MRKTGWWMVSAIFLFVLGCGGGDQPTTSVTTPGGGAEPALPAGYGLIKLTIQQGDAGPSAQGPRTLAPAGSQPAADNVRIAARLVRTQDVPELDDNGSPTGQIVTITSEIYRKIVDVSLPATSGVSIAVPAENGYVVEVLSSVAGTDGNGNPVHILLKYGKTASPVNVTAGIDTGVTIVAAPITDGLTITPPDNVIAGSRYTFPVAINNIPLRGNFFINQYVDNVSNSPPPAIFVFDNSSRLPSFTAQTLTTRPPSAADHWDLYFQGLFYIDPTWQSDTEVSNANWYKKYVFYYPNRNAGWVDPYLTSPLYPLGSVNITVTLSPSI